MTTETCYIVAYPHPKVLRQTRILPFEGEGGKFLGAALHKDICDAYPDLRDDLRLATLWKASRSTMAQLSP